MDESELKTSMMTSREAISSETLPNGPGAAAILAAGIGSAAFGLFALAGDAFPAINKLFTFYTPSLLAVGVLLTFPPFMDLLQGK